MNVEETKTKMAMRTINRITLKAYENMFADRALVCQSCSCCHDTRCRGKSDIFVNAC